MEVGRLSYSLAQTRVFLDTVQRLRAGQLLSWQEGILLRMFMSASDERDLVYGLIGVIESDEFRQIVPDYSLDSRRRVCAALGSGESC